MISQSRFPVTYRQYFSRKTPVHTCKWSWPTSWNDARIYRTFHYIAIQQITQNPAILRCIYNYWLQNIPFFRCRNLEDSWVRHIKAEMLTASGNARVHRTSPIIAQQQITQNPATLGCSHEAHSTFKCRGCGSKTACCTRQGNNKPLFRS